MEEKFLKNINKYKTLIEITIALIIFVALYINNKILTEVSFFEILSVFLSFIILVEVIRMLGQYLVTNHISVTLMIDMVIIFICRDILLTISIKLPSCKQLGFLDNPNNSDCKDFHFS